MKRGAFAVSRAPSGTRPDLDGLSCRFEEIPSARGVMLSLLVTPTAAPDALAFRRVIEDIIALAEQSPDAGRPIPAQGPAIRWLPQGFKLEISAASRRRGFLKFFVVLVRTMVAVFFMRTGLSAGGFAPQVYLQQVVENSDFRKFDDGLRMVIDCTPQLAAAIEHRLAAAASEGAVRYGLHAQDAAMITCFTPSPTRSDHVHFIDGARGGYALAATALKSM
jgi:hypothetical protein